jgi:hypothetical protein
MAKRIRQKLHPQIKELWRVHRALKRLRQTAIVSKGNIGGAFANAEGPFDIDRDVERYPAREDEVDLTAPIESGGSEFVPLVRELMHLNCSLSVTFLRQEDPGQLILQGSDLDGRIKILLDALTVPNHDVSARHPPSNGPTYCLMESDALVSDLKLETGRFLTPGDRHVHEVHLMIHVAINVLRVGPWNMPLLGP